MEQTEPSRDVGNHTATDSPGNLQEFAYRVPTVMKKTENWFQHRSRGWLNCPRMSLEVKKNTTRYHCNKIGFKNLPKFWRNVHRNRQYSIWATKIKHGMIRAARQHLKAQKIRAKITSAGIHSIAVHIFEPDLQQISHISNFQLPKHQEMPFKFTAVTSCGKCWNGQIGRVGNRKGKCYSCLRVQDPEIEVTEDAFQQVSCDQMLRNMQGIPEKPVSPVFRITGRDF
jgi:hypothetical protein